MENYYGSYDSVRINFTQIYHKNLMKINKCYNHHRNVMVIIIFKGKKSVGSKNEVKYFNILK